MRVDGELFMHIGNGLRVGERVAALLLGRAGRLLLLKRTDLVFLGILLLFILHHLALLAVHLPISLMQVVLVLVLIDLQHWQLDLYSLLDHCSLMRLIIGVLLLSLLQQRFILLVLVLLWFAPSYWRSTIAVNHGWNVQVGVRIAY